MAEASSVANETRRHASVHSFRQPGAVVRGRMNEARRTSRSSNLDRPSDSPSASEMYDSKGAWPMMEAAVSRCWWVSHSLGGEAGVDQREVGLNGEAGEGGRRGDALLGDVGVS